jgi:hypothetical protein
MTTTIAAPQIPALSLRTAGRFVARTPVSGIYLAVLVVMQVVWTYGSPAFLGRIVAVTSTNVDNLAAGKLSTLITSAFILDDGNAWVLLPLIGAALAAGELLWGSRRLLGVFVAGHVGATLIVFGGLFVGTHLGLLSSSVDNAADVGISYGLAAVIGALAFEMPRRYGAIWASAWVGLVAVALIAAPSFTAYGHCIALALGLLVGAGFRGRRQPIARRLANLSGEFGLGFVMTTAGFATSTAAVIGFVEMADADSVQSLAMVVLGFGTALAVSMADGAAERPQEVAPPVATTRR